MSEEIDLDAFVGFGEVVELDPIDPAPVDPAVEAAVAAAQQELAKVVEVVTEKPDDSTFIVGVVFRSHESGPPHIVSIVDGGPKVGRYVSCNCAAMRSLGHRPQGCWAMVYVRRLVGIREEVSSE